MLKYDGEDNEAVIVALAPGVLIFVIGWMEPMLPRIPGERKAARFGCVLMCSSSSDECLYAVGTALWGPVLPRLTEPRGSRELKEYVLPGISPS